MDQTGAAFVEAVEPYGPGALLVVGIGIALVAVLCAFVLPSWRKNLEAQQALEKMKAEAQIKLESEREKRKAHEAEQQAEDNRKRAETDAKTAVLMEGMKTSIDAMNTTLTATLARVNESGNRSSKMGETVEDTNRLVTEIHHAIVK